MKQSKAAIRQEMKPLYIIKLGGSVITNKAENKQEFYPKIIERIADKINKARKQKDFSLIIVHGVGPYGHKLVKEYNIKDGITTPLQYEGFHKTHESVLSLNKQIIQIFENKNLPVQNFIPLDIFTTENKQIQHAEIAAIKQTLDNQKIPILFGDMVVDQQLTAIPLSGDDIACYLAQQLNADSLFFGSDVDGIYDKNKKIIKEINKQNLAQYIRAIGNSKHIDVTGGMKNKIEKVQQYKNNYTTYIFNLNKEKALYKNLVGKYNGTKIDL
jgi:isopentenyl phosphate kinase